MDEGAAFGVRRHVARSGVLEAFNDRSLAAAVVTHDDGERGEEFDDVDGLVIEASDATNG